MILKLWCKKICGHTDLNCGPTDYEGARILNQPVVSNFNESDCKKLMYLLQLDLTD